MRNGDFRFLNRSLRMVAAKALLASVATMPAVAGELTVAWTPSESREIAGYRVYVGAEPGVYTRIEDAGKNAKIVLRDLEDERTHFVAVKAYDGRGKDVSGFSQELATMPRPRVDSVEPSTLVPGTKAYVVLHGANVDRQAQLKARDPRIAVRSAVRAGDGTVIALIEALAAPSARPSSAVSLAPSSFQIVNPGRKAEEFFRAHPEVVDVDNDNRVDDADLRILQAAFGTKSGDAHYGVPADLDGDGVVDGRDLSRVIARLGTSSGSSN